MKEQSTKHVHEQAACLLVALNRHDLRDDSIGRELQVRDAQLRIAATRNSHEAAQRDPELTEAEFGKS